ncbi:MAG: Uma2 family endonuclease [Acidobacteriaceae bacterium]|nr:Uma2 family endonuclease [Acidobacteriaceae bacterium]
MASAHVLPQVSVEEYERTPELFERHEYVDGVLIEKPVPTWKHTRLQGWFSVLFWKYYSIFDAGPELHSKLREKNWRIPDFAVQKPEVSNQEKYAVAPLLLAIEIRSPEDKWGEILTKFEDYHAWGVPYCWLFDPETERAWTYHKSEDFEEVTGKGRIQAGDIQLSLEEIFSRLHQS